MYACAYIYVYVSMHIYNYAYTAVNIFFLIEMINPNANFWSFLNPFLQSQMSSN